MTQEARESPCHGQPGKSLGQQVEALLIPVPQPGHWPGSWVWSSGSGEARP